MKSYLRRGFSKSRAIVGMATIGIALFLSGIAQASPQYNLTCVDCHEMPPVDSATGLREPSSGAFRGNHQTHAGSIANSCTKCHGSGVLSYPTGHRDKTIQVNGDINGYIGNAPVAASYNTSRTFLNQTSKPVLANCSNVSCHFESATENWGVLPASTYSTLGANGTTCSKCHGAAPSDGSHPSTSGSGKKHGDYFGTGTGSCVKCHPNHAGDASPFSHATSAGKRSLILQFSAPNSGGSYSQSANLNYPNYLPSQNPVRNGSCASLYCHSDGNSNPPNTTPVWGGSLPADCAGCHGGNSGSSNILGSGKHGKHMNNAGFLGTDYQCARCHSATVSVGNDRAITTIANHVDGNKEVIFNDGGSYSGGSCSATLCHSAGKSAAAQPVAPTWSQSGTLDCRGCHGVGGNYGEPSYANAGSALDLANSHNAKHVSGAASCANCHNSTTVDGVSIKPGSTVHTDGSINVNFSAFYDLGGAAYNNAIGTKSCSSVYCHSNGDGAAPVQTPKWGGSMPSNCTGCHGNDASTATPMATNKHRSHMNNYSTLGRANNFKCAECHAKTVSLASNQSVTNSANHVNKYKDYSGARAGGNYDTSAKVCSNVYCHSSGEAVGNVYRNMTGSKAWGGSAKLACNGCHGYGPGAFTPIAGEPNYTNGGGGTASANSHLAHVTYLGVTDSTGCAKCHRTTIDETKPNKLKDYSSSHLDRKIDIAFQVIANYTGHYTPGVGNKTCGNTYCHAGSATQWGGPPKICSDCHKADATLPGNHNKHWQSTGIIATVYLATPGNTGDASNYRFMCSSCHQGIDANGPAAGGGGASAEIMFGYTSANRHGSYTYGTTKTGDGTLTWTTNGNCSGIYCHSNGNGSDPYYTAISWTTPGGTLGCNGCHGDAKTAGKLLNTGYHQNHVNKATSPTLGNTFGCVECHAKTVSNNSTLIDKTKHVNKYKDYSGAKAGKIASSGSGSCANVYCHSSGQAVPTYRTPQNWNVAGTSYNCKSCHGADSTGPAGVFTTQFGEPNYSNYSSANRNYYNSHSAKHISASSDCSLCHVNTVNSSFALVSSAGVGAHLNTARDVNFDASSIRVGNGGAAYNAAAKTCSNVKCHSNGQATPSYTTPRWGSAMPADCTGCHGGNVTASVVLASGTHTQHINKASFLGTNYECGRCHANTVTVGNDRAITGSMHVNGSRDVYFNNGGSYSASTCSATLCHAAGKAAAPQPTAPVWGGAALDCKGCHGVGSAYGEPSYANAGAALDLANSHNAKHVSGSASCGNCHANTTVDGVSIKSGSTIHTDGSINVNFSATYDLGGAAYNNAIGTKSCSATYCHSNGNGAASLQVPKWGDSMPANCTGCHGGDTTTATPIATLKHSRHMNNYTTLGRGNNMKCADCHAKTVALASNQAVSNSANHVNRFKDYSGVKAGNSAGYNTSTKVCSNVYCHSSGQATPVFRSMTGSKAWDKTASLGCNGCHGYGAGYFTPVAGEPNYASAAGSENSHKKHTVDAGMTDSRGCANCHRTTVDSTIANKLKDYSSAHLNKVRDVNFAVIANYTGHYTAGTKNCANTYCHAGSSATWGGASLLCNSCHKADATLAGDHNKHWETSGTIATGYSNTPGNVTGTTGNYRFECSSCHQGNHAKGPSTAGNAAEVFFGYSTTGHRGSYTYGGTTTTDGTLKWSNGTCANTYCHSNGNGAAGNNVSFTWTDSGVLGCNGCHGDAKTAGKLLNTGYHQNHVNKATSPTLGNTFGCVECHAKTVSNNSTLVDKSKHVNKFKDYSGAKAGKIASSGSGSCANVYCHSSGQALPTYRTAANWYVAGTSYNCKSCHGADSTGPAGVFTTQFGEPNYNNYSSANRNFYNSHSSKHISASSDCALCHVNTVNSSFALVSSAGVGAHLNTARDVNFDSSNARVGNGGAAYNAAAKSCSNVKCHSNGQSTPSYKTPRWGSAMPADCTGCHAGNATASAVLASGSHTAHMNQAGVIGSNYECGRCHASTVTVGNDRAITGALHVNGAPDVVFNNGGSYSASTCSATLCHAAGKSAAPQPTAPVWGGAALDCKGCHGVGSSYGEPNYANAGAALDLANSHSSKHVSGSASCGNCHANTTTDGVTIKSGSTSHTSGGIDVNFSATYDLGGAAYNNAIGTKSCSATYCHSNGNGAASLQVPKWGDSMPANCTGCHGGDTTTATPIATYKHSRHMNNYTTLGRGNNMKCADCHAKTVALASNQAISNSANHVNRFKDYSGVKAGNSAGYNTSTKVCSNVYCHSSGQATPVFRSMTGSKAWDKTASLGCNGCHGYGAGAFTPVAGEPNYASAAGSENSHKKHTVDAGMTDSTGCANCHRTTVDSTTVNKLKDYSSAHLNKTRDVNFAVIANYTGHYTAGTKTCANTYCHAGSTATWGGASLLCNSCHKADATLAGRHSAHWETTGTVATGYANTPGNVTGTTTNYRFECSSCHQGNHAKGPAAGGNAAEVQFGYSSAGHRGTYSYGGTTANDGSLQWSNGTCATTYCHSNGNGAAGFNTTFDWNDAAKQLRCDGCHGGDASKTNKINTGLHLNHIDPATNVSLGTGNGRKCSECHAKTVSFANNTTIVDKTKHVNKFKDYSGVYARGNANYNQTTKSCSSLYCHSNGKPGTAVFEYKNPAAWNTATTYQCNGCHGNNTVNVDSGFATNPSLGAPNYLNGGLATATANSHKLHVSKLGITDSTGCYTCHSRTVDKNTASKFRPYSTMHVSGGTNIRFAGISSAWKGSYTPGVGNMTCSNVACHSNGRGSYTNAQWGGTSNCGMCHPMNKLSRGHAFHVYTSATNNTPAFYDNFTANRSNGSAAPGRYNYGCAICHPVLSGTTHGKGNVLIDLKASAAGGSLKAKNGSAITAGAVVAGTAGSGTSGTPGVSITCSNVYCHSNGYTSGTLVYATTPDWYTGSFTGDRCANCHGNWPNTTIAGSPTHYNTNWVGGGQAGGHAVGIHSASIVNGVNFTGLLAPGSTGSVSHGVAGQATTISCNTCHYATVTVSTNNSSAQCSGCHTQAATQASASIANKAMHVNGSTEVQFAPTVFVSKAQLRDASFSLNSSATLWHRNGGYKAGATSYDSSKLSLSSASPYSSLNGCSNVVCHFNQNIKWTNPAPVLTCNGCHSKL